MLVQKLLKSTGANIKVDGMCGKNSIKAIKLFQKKRLNFKYPDGVIDVNKKTYKKLVAIATRKGGGGRG